MKHGGIKDVPDYIRSLEDQISHLEFPFFLGVADLVEASDYCQKQASVEVHTEWPPGIDPLVDGGRHFDGLVIKFVQVLHSILGDFGKTSVGPYSKGILTRSMKFTFEP
jgi:hypothetical protein